MCQLQAPWCRELMGAGAEPCSSESTAQVPPHESSGRGLAGVTEVCHLGILFPRDLKKQALVQAESI